MDKEKGKEKKESGKRLEKKENKNFNFPEEGEVLLGKVERIIGTSVFIKLIDYGKEGVMNFSEVSPGRIRNIRNYVKIGQKIVCKVLRVDKIKGHIDLSLRRVSTREKKEVLGMYKRKKEALVMLNLTIKNKERLAKVINKIKKGINLAQLIEGLIILSPKEKISKLKSFGFNENEAESFIRLVKEKVKEKEIKVKSEIILSSEAGDGIERIKRIFKKVKEEKTEIKYLGAPYYLITLKGTNYKDANKKLEEITDKIEKDAKALGCNFEIVKEKK